VSFFSGIRDYYCASIKISTVQQLYTTYDGETDGRSFEQFIITNTPTASGGDLTISEGPTDGGGGFSFSRTTPAPSSSSSDGGNNSSNDGVNGNGGGNNDDSNNDNGNGNGGNSSKSSTPIGPIVGGVVGGVAALGLIGLGTFFLIRRNRNGAAGASAAAAGGSGPAQQPPMQQQQQQPGAPGYPQQPYGYPPQQVQGYYPGGTPGTDQKPAGFVDMTPVPDRHDSTSPVSQFSDSRYSSVPPQGPMGVPQQQQQPPHSPASTLASSNWGPQPGQVQQQSNVPPTVHEAGGNVVGERDYNANHRGQFHELQ